MLLKVAVLSVEEAKHDQESTAYLLSDLICLLLLDAASVKNKPATPPNKEMAAPQVSGGTTGDATPDGVRFLEESGSTLHPPNPSFI